LKCIEQRFHIFLLIELLHNFRFLAKKLDMFIDFPYSSSISSDPNHSKADTFGALPPSLGLPWAVSMLSLPWSRVEGPEEKDLLFRFRWSLTAPWFNSDYCT